MDGFIDDNEDFDWRAELRTVTRECCVCVCVCAGSREVVSLWCGCETAGAGKSALSATAGCINLALPTYSLCLCHAVFLCHTPTRCHLDTHTHTNTPATPPGYDPSKYRDSAADDRSMEASAADIAREEARSRRIAKTEDEREAEAEARRAAAKEAKRAASKKRKGAGGYFDD